MVQVLIAYHNIGEISKVANRLNKLLLENKFKPTIFEINIEQDFDLKKQFKKEKELTITNPIKSLKDFDIIFIGTPVISFKSVPAVNTFIRNLTNVKDKKIILFATGIGLPGKAIKKMSSLLSMKGNQVIETQFFSSIFEFDERKLKEVDIFFEKMQNKLK